MADTVRVGQLPAADGSRQEKLVWGDKLSAHPEWAALAATQYLVDPNSGLALPVSVTNPVTVQPKPFTRDPANEQSTLLAANATFTGAWVEIDEYLSLVLSWYSFQQPASYTVEFSADGITEDTGVRQTIAPVFLSAQGIWTIFASFNPAGNKYYRVVIQNGASNQTFVQASNLLISAPYTGQYQSLGNPPILASPALLTRAVSTGIDPNGTFVSAPGAGVSNSNSSTTPLAGNATFTPASWIDTEGYGGMTVAVSTDQNGTLLVDLSEDSVTVDETTSIPITANFPYFTGILPVARYIRIRYTNGSVAQTTFRLQTILKVQPLSAILDQQNSQTLNGLNQSALVTTNSGYASIAVYVGSATNFVGTLAFEATTDGVHWTPRTARQSASAITGNIFVESITGTLANPLPPTVDYRANAAGFSAFRVRVSSYTSGSCVVEVQASVGAGTIVPTTPFTLAPATAAVVTTTTVGVTPVQVDTGLLQRKSVEVHYRDSNPNNSAGFLAFASGFSQTQARRLALGESIVLELSEGVAIWCSASTTNTLFDCIEVGS